MNQAALGIAQLHLPVQDTTAPSAETLRRGAAFIEQQRATRSLVWVPSCVKKKRQPFFFGNPPRDPLAEFAAHKSVGSCFLLDTRIKGLGSFVSDSVTMESGSQEPR